MIDGKQIRADLEEAREDLREAIAGMGSDPDINAALAAEVNRAGGVVHRIRLQLDEEKRLVLAGESDDALTLLALYELVEEIAWTYCERALLDAWRGLKAMEKVRGSA